LTAIQIIPTNTIKQMHAASRRMIQQGSRLKEQVPHPHAEGS
jgi:hypothetical protein